MPAETCNISSEQQQKVRGQIEANLFAEVCPLAFWDGRDAHQSQTGAAKQRIARRAGL